MFYVCYLQNYESWCNLLKLLKKICYNLKNKIELEFNNMYSVMDVARYVINYSNEKGYKITNLKLQKLLYFIQAIFLTNKDYQCFEERIEAWDYGPVVPDVYKEFKKYGSSSIPTISSYSVFNEETWKIEEHTVDSNLICEEDRILIDGVIDHFSNKTANDLVNLTHKQSPWRDVYKKWSNEEITPESIKEYFS